MLSVACIPYIRHAKLLLERALHHHHVGYRLGEDLSNRYPTCERVPTELRLSLTLKDRIRSTRRRRVNFAEHRDIHPSIVLDSSSVAACPLHADLLHLTLLQMQTAHDVKPSTWMRRGDYRNRWKHTCVRVSGYSSAHLRHMWRGDTVCVGRGSSHSLHCVCYCL